jgi:hypothetical protein
MFGVFASITVVLTDRLARDNLRVLQRRLFSEGSIVAMIDSSRFL